MASSFVNNLVSGNLANSPSNPIHAALTPAPAKSTGYFWKGNDGKVYVQGSNGINAAGNWDANSQNYWGSKGFVHTPDSAAAAQAAPAGNGGNAGNTGGNTGGGGYGSGGGGGAASSATIYPDKSAEIATNQAGYDSVAGQVNAGIASIDRNVAANTSQYDAEKTANEGDYKTSSDTNQGNLQKNKQSAMINAAQGRRGLFGTLASLGALNGDGIDLANDAVQKGANEDLSTANDTYATNQQSLEGSIKKFRDADVLRRSQDVAKAADEKRSVQGQGAKDRQTYLQKMSDAYRAENNNGRADEIAKQVASLFPEIGANNVPVSAIAPQAAAYTSTSLAHYLAGVDNTQVKTTPNSAAGSTVPGLPGLVASTKKLQQQ